MIIIMNLDIIQNIQRYAHENIVHLLSTCKSWHELLSYCRFDHYHVRSNESVKYCLRTFDKIEKYQSFEHDRCEHLVLHDDVINLMHITRDKTFETHWHQLMKCNKSKCIRHASEFKRLRLKLPEQLKSLKMFNCTYVMSDHDLIEGSNALEHFEIICVENISMRFDVAKNFSIRKIRLRDYNTYQLHISLPLTLKTLKVHSEISTWNCHLPHLQILKLNGKNINLSSCKSIHTLQLNHLIDIDHLPRSIKSLRIETMQLVNFTTDFKVLKHLYIECCERITALPNSLKSLTINSKCDIQCNIPTQLKSLRLRGHSHLHHLHQLFNDHSLPDTLIKIHINVLKPYWQNEEVHITRLPSRLQYLTLKKIQPLFACQLPSSLTHLHIHDARIDNENILSDTIQSLKIHALHCKLPAQCISVQAYVIKMHDTFPSNLEILACNICKFSQTLPESLRVFSILRSCSRIYQTLPVNLEYLSIFNYNEPLQLAPFTRLQHVHLPHYTHALTIQSNNLTYFKTYWDQLSVKEFLKKV